MNILLIGDIFGRCGMDFIASVLRETMAEENIDFVVANAENASGGNGLSTADYYTLTDIGVDVITMGNHTFGHKEILRIFKNENNIIRPLNYPAGTPGEGSIVTKCKGKRIGIINIMGRVNILNIDCPFAAVSQKIENLKDKTDIIIVDFHADATSEKRAMGFYLDGKVTCVFGTHTHVQTADECLLPRGTAYITDLGMTGVEQSVIGVKSEASIAKFVTALPTRFEPAQGKAMMCGAVLTVDDETCKAISLKRIVKR